MSKSRAGKLRLIWIEAFLEVAEIRSYDAAGEVLGCDPTSASRYIGALEQWLGKKLIAGTHPVQLSEDGTAFVPVAKQVLDRLVSSRAEIAS